MKTCSQCDKPIDDPKHPSRKYCSRKCFAESQRKHDLSKRACVICGALFSPHRPTQRFCSLECFGESQRHPPHICETCGKKFPHVSSAANRFCSYDCANIGQRDRIEVTCEICGKDFGVNRYRFEHSNTRFCSRDCKTEAGRRNLTCEQCGKTVNIRAHFVESGKYAARFCCYDCAAEWQKGENHSNWQGGHEKWRGPNWIRQKNKARERDNYTCQKCGITEDELGRPMDVHHTEPWRNFDHDWKQANRLTNLISLCPTCHTTIERNGNTIHRNHTSQALPQ